IKQETSDSTVLAGPTPEELLRFQDQRRPDAAFAALLNPVGLSGNLLTPFGRQRGRGPGDPLETCGWWRQRPSGGIQRRVRRFAQRRFANRLLPRARTRMGGFLNRAEGELSVMEVLDLYYREYSGSDMFNYFAFRMGQPRHLAALALVCLLTRGKGPLLDVACGVGHLAHYLTGSTGNPWVIGIDRDFFRLYVASKYVA